MSTEYGRKSCLRSPGGDVSPRMWKSASCFHSNSRWSSPCRELGKSGFGFVGSSKAIGLKSWWKAVLNCARKAIVDGSALSRLNCSVQSVARR